MQNVNLSPNGNHFPADHKKSQEKKAGKKPRKNKNIAKKTDYCTKAKKKYRNKSLKWSLNGYLVLVTAHQPVLTCVLDCTKLRSNAIYHRVAGSVWHLCHMEEVSKGKEEIALPGVASELHMRCGLGGWGSAVWGGATSPHHTLT